MMLFSPAGGDTGETPAEVVAYALPRGLVARDRALRSRLDRALRRLRERASRPLRRIATAGEATLLLVGGVIFTVGLALALTIWSAPLLDMPDDSALRWVRPRRISRWTTSAGSHSRWRASARR